ncbi:hypothetical protein AAH979_06880 [Plantactinospora sp. ZYX-F-223]|uniref:hypothetical protein n=1 Tax=Plantactinospora sp. ZYX-F-223 TaxID=3144103 RepID=UPI0031FBC7C1
MRVFVAGGAGVLGRRPVPPLDPTSTGGRGFSTAKATRELGWRLRCPSWRQGFEEELA